MSGTELSTRFNDRGTQISNLQSYYRLHALIYDLTRWAFLFGRSEVIKRLPAPEDLRLSSSRPAGERLRLLEVGCGTGVNLAALARKYPEAHLTGVDLSGDMLRKARKKLAHLGDERVSLFEEPYQAGGNAGTDFDLVLFSYSLSMINPQWGEVLDQAHADLREGGLVAAVDFSSTDYKSFQNHM